jgi:formamidopyrimidine-DNA glycosylase
MPENAEVALTADMISSFRECYLTNVTVVNGRYMRKDLPGLSCAMAQLPFKLAKVKTHGKFLWMEFSDLYSPTTDGISDKRLYLMNTLGLEGRWSNTRIKNVAIKFWFYDPIKRKTRTLWWADQRNFGTLVFTEDRKMLDKKLAKLAPDLLLGKHSSSLIWERFTKASKAKKWQTKPIVELLMDQNAVVSGIGNYLSVEILYVARISPRTLVTKIVNSMFRRLYRAMCSVVASSYYHNCTRYIDHLVGLKPLQLPLERYKDNKPFRFNVYLQKKTVDGHKVIKERMLSNRTSYTYWCPSVQK